MIKEILEAEINEAIKAKEGEYVFMWNEMRGVYIIQEIEFVGPYDNEDGDMEEYGYEGERILFDEYYTTQKDIKLVGKIKKKNVWEVLEYDS